MRSILASLAVGFVIGLAVLVGLDSMARGDEPQPDTWSKGQVALIGGMCKDVDLLTAIAQGYDSGEFEKANDLFQDLIEDDVYVIGSSVFPVILVERISGPYQVGTTYAYIWRIQALDKGAGWYVLLDATSAPKRGA